jgi:hypothetical protein
MFIARHIKLLNGIPRDISRRLYTMTSEGRTGRLEDTIREKVKWIHFLMTIAGELELIDYFFLVIYSSRARIAFYHKRFLATSPSRSDA